MYQNSRSIFGILGIFMPLIPFSVSSALASPKRGSLNLRLAFGNPSTADRSNKIPGNKSSLFAVNRAG